MKQNRRLLPFTASAETCESAAGRDCAAALGWIPWLILYFAVVLFILGGSERSVTRLYFEASENWMQGKDLYVVGGRGFLYFPQAAILTIPFAALPRLPGDILWRLVTIGIFAIGVWRLSRLASRSRPNTIFAVMSWISATLSWSGALNGQSTLTMAGLMMLAAGDLIQSRYNRAALLLALALAIKPLALVLLLVAAVLWPRLAPRLLVACGIGLAVPFLAQSAGYAVEQYADCLIMLGDAARLGAQKPWAQLFGMLKVADIEFSESVQTAARIVAAGLTLATAWYIRRRFEPARAILYIYALTTCYLMLFNPRTENNSYAMLAPAIGWCCAEAFLVERRSWSGLFFVVIALGTIGSHEFGRQLLPSSRAIWLAPLMASWFAGMLLIRLWQEARALPEETRPRITLASVSRAPLQGPLEDVAGPAQSTREANSPQAAKSPKSSRLAESAADRE